MSEYAQKAYFAILAGVELWIKEVQRLELFAITQTGAIWAWVVASAATPSQRHLALAIPVVLNLIIAIKFAAIYLHVRTHVDYLRRLEHEMGLGDTGWETLLAKARKGRRVFVPLRLFEAAFIGTILVASLLAFAFAGRLLAAH